MDQVLHGSARTTPAVRQAIQASSESLAKLAVRYGLNEKTVAKWRGRTTTQDASMGPKNPVSTVLSPLEEAAALTFRQHTHLPLDDCLYDLIYAPGGSANTGLVPVNVNSTRDNLIQAYPHAAENLGRLPSDFTLRQTPGIRYKK